MQRFLLNSKQIKFSNLITKQFPETKTSHNEYRIQIQSTNSRKELNNNKKNHPEIPIEYRVSVKPNSLPNVKGLPAEAEPEAKGRRTPNLTPIVSPAFQGDLQHPPTLHAPPDIGHNPRPSCTPPNRVQSMFSRNHQEGFDSNPQVQLIKEEKGFWGPKKQDGVLWRGILWIPGVRWDGRHTRRASFRWWIRKGMGWEWWCLPSISSPPLEIVCVVGFGFSVSSVEGGVNCKAD